MDLNKCESIFNRNMKDLLGVVEFYTDYRDVQSSISSAHRNLCDECSDNSAISSLDGEVADMIDDKVKSMGKDISYCVDKMSNEFNDLWNYCSTACESLEEAESENKNLSDEKDKLECEKEDLIYEVELEKEERIKIERALEKIGERRKIPVEQVKKIIDDLREDNLFSRYMELEI
jgi:hypothetical protein